MPVFQRNHARCACAGASGPFVLAGTERKYERSRPFTVKHLGLDVTVDPAEKAIPAKATLECSRRAPSVQELELDAVGFEISRVRLNTGKGPHAADYTYDGDKITVRVPPSAKAFTVEIVYRASSRSAACISSRRTPP